MSPTYYYRQYRRPPWGQSFATTVVGKLIIANVAAFVLALVFRPYFGRLFALQPRAVIENFYVWQLVSYMFLHAGLWHLFFNMLVLFFFGPAIELAWGANRFVKYYIACGVGAGLLHMAASYNSSVIGASGAVFGVLVAYALMYPDQVVLFMFVIPVRVKYLVVGLIAFELLTGIQTRDGIAHFAHLGGAATGLLFFRDEIRHKLRVSAAPKKRWDSIIKARRERRHEQESENIDSILDKISEKGYDNLTTTEKRILENYSRKHQEESDED